MFGRLFLVLVSCLTIGIQAQGLWDYNDYNSVLFPPAFGGSFPPFNNNMQRQVQAPQFSQQRPEFRPPNEFRQPSPSFPSQLLPNHRLGSASYRPSAGGNQQPTGFSNGGPYYTGRGNDFVGSSTEQRAFAQSNHGDLDSLLAKIVTKLPAIADQLSQIMTTTPGTPKINPDFWLPFVQPDSQTTEFESNQQRRAPSTVINSMPDPSAFFSFGKLLSAFSGSALDSSDKFAKQVDAAPIEEHSVDVESIKGIPILKDEDQEPEVVHKVEDELPAAHSLESNESHQTEEETTGTPELIIFTLPTNSEESTTVEPTTTTSSNKDEGNLLGSLLSGKLDKVDWIGSIFGSNKPGSNKQASEDGNALAQLFGGNIFGSAVNDDDSTKQRKYEDRNFH